MTRDQVKYFSYVGSYDGAVKIRGRWVRVTELNRINKTGWLRVQPTNAAHRACKEQRPLRADKLFPGLVGTVSSRASAANNLQGIVPRDSFGEIRGKLQAIARDQGMNRAAKIRRMLVCDQGFAKWDEAEQMGLIHNILRH